jgi:hypothetical protein
MLATILTLDHQLRLYELLAGLDEEAGQQEDSAGGQGLRGALASTVGARLMTQVSARNLIACAL